MMIVSLRIAEWILRERRFVVQTVPNDRALVFYVYELVKNIPLNSDNF